MPLHGTSVAFPGTKPCSSPGDQKQAGLAAVPSATDAAGNCVNELQTEVTVELGKESSFLKEM